MVALRVLLIRGSLLANLLMLFYLCAVWISSPPAHHGSQMQQHYRALEGFVEQASLKSPVYTVDTAEAAKKDITLDVLKESSNNLNIADSVPLKEPAQVISEDIGDPEKNDMLLDGKVKVSKEESAIEKVGIAMAEKESQLSVNPYYDPRFKEPPREVQESQGVTEHPHAAIIPTDEPDPPPDSLERKMYPDFRGCTTRAQVPFHSQRGEFWVLENYIPAALPFRCDETITYTTHGDYTFLDNLETLTSRWQVWNFILF